MFARTTCALVWIGMLAACSHRAGALGGNAAADASGAEDAALIDSTQPGDAARMLDASPADAAYVPPDPFTVDTSCPAMSFDQLAARFPPGETVAAAGQLTWTSRVRASCNAITGCTPWSWPAPVSLAQAIARAGFPSGSVHAVPAGGALTLALDTSQQVPFIELQMQATEPGAPSNTIVLTCGQIKQGGLADALDCSIDVSFPTDPPSLLFFVDNTAEQPLFDGTTVVFWHGRICSDGTYQLVSKLAAELSPNVPVDSANNRNQFAVYGQL
jgi:hypothetical protein